MRSIPTDAEFAALPMDAPASGDTIRLVDLNAQYARLKDEIDRRIRGVFAHGAFVGGPEIEQLEAALAARAGVAHAVTVASGTDALLVALMGEGIGAGDAVFVPAFTYAACAGAVMQAGATPVFVDVRQTTYTIDPENLERCIEALAREGRLEARAVMAVDLFGMPADYPAIREVAARHGLFVVADAAQSFGGALGPTPVGALAPATATSFFPSKPLGCYGDGGALFTDDAGRAARWRSIRLHGFEDDDKSDAVRVGLNSRLDTLQAAVLFAKLTVFDAELQACERLARLYDERLKGAALPPPRPGQARSSWAHYSVLVAHRDRVSAALTRAGVATGVYYPRPLHLHSAYRHLGPEPGALPVAEALCGQILSLPMHAYLGEAAVERVCATLAAARA
ncbi:MAG: DegT/DnrJ/EryC1/StrS family aminotransferase [Alphaproteobacteria bacterium]